MSKNKNPLLDSFVIERDLNPESAETIELLSLLIQQNAGLAHRVAEKCLKYGPEPFDLIYSLCLDGLERSLFRYQPTAGNLSSYAPSFMRGSVLNHYRNQYGSYPKIPRQWFETYKQVKNLSEQTGLGFEAIATGLNIAQADWQEIYNAVESRKYFVVPLDQDDLERIPSPEKGDKNSNFDRVRQIVQGMNDPWRNVLVRHFWSRQPVRSKDRAILNQGLTIVREQFEAS